MTLGPPTRIPLVIAADAWAGDQFGGQYKIATELAIAASTAGREVHYICSSRNGATIGMAEEQGVLVWRYKPPHAGANPLAKLRAHLEGGAMALRQSAARLNRPFVFNGHGPMAYYAGLRCSNVAISRRVMSVHSPLVAEFRANQVEPPRLSQWPLQRFFRHVDSTCYAKSDEIQAFSRYMADLVEANSERLLGRVRVCPGYVDYRAMALDISRVEARKRLGLSCWDTADVCFFSLRRHSPRMGLDNLIRALSRVRREHPTLPSCRLVLGGDGPQTPMLRDLASSLSLSSIVHFVGRIAERDKALHYRAADCFVLPTLALEGFGLIVLEAFAAGSPVIATPVGAIPEIVGSHGTLTNGVDEGAIFQALVRFLAASGAPDGLDGARRDYARRFDKETVLPHLESIVMGEGA